MGTRLVVLKQAQDLGDGVPEWIQLFPAGRVLIEDSPDAVMDAEGAALILKHFKSLLHDVVIDYEHQTLTGDEAPAAGWIRELDWREGDGLYARVEWTDKAHGYIERREYRYHSPVFLCRESDRRIVELYNVALTNQPRMMNVAALAAKNTKLTGDKSMNEFLKLLGLQPDTTEDDAVEVLKKVLGERDELQTKLKSTPEMVACKDVLSALELDEKADATTVVAKIKGLSASGMAATDLGQQVEALKKRLNTMQATGVVEEALKNGQITPAEAQTWGNDLAASDPKQFEVIVLSRPKYSAVPLHDLAPKADADAADPDADALQLEINKKLGIDAETYKKFGPAETEE